jgi:hypothetical protein
MRIIDRGRILRRRVPYTDAGLAVLADTSLPDAEVARRLDRSLEVVVQSRRAESKWGR